MIILSWNVRGFNKLQRRKDVLQLCESRKADFFGVLETKIKDANLRSYLSIFDENWHWIHSGKNGKSRIIVFWRKNAVSVTSLELSDQFICCDFVIQSSSEVGRIIFVYGSNVDCERLTLWQSLLSLSCSSPCLLVGDFNAILKQGERRGRNCSLPDVPFVEFTYDAGLFDTPSTGCLYTWTNRRIGEESIVAKLDRSLANSDWMQIFPSTRAHFLVPGISDHSVMEIHTRDSIPSRPKPFKFYNSWIKHPLFDSLVRGIWGTFIDGSPRS